MAFVTQERARGILRSGPALKASIETELRKSAASDLDARYDVFLSHSYLDKDLVLAATRMLERAGLSVYVDWLEDPQADRTAVTAATAHVLRRRMRNSQSFIFATSTTSSRSRWMPWELGFFDGLRPGRVAVFPLIPAGEGRFVGQEYLGLYPYVEDLGHVPGSIQLGIKRSGGKEQLVAKFAAGIWP
jgi:hypothetical protein